MKLVLLVVALFSLSLTVYGSASHDKNTDAEPTTAVPSTIPAADKILAEQVEITNRMVNDTLRGTSSAHRRAK